MIKNKNAKLESSNSFLARNFFQNFLLESYLKERTDMKKFLNNILIIVLLITLSFVAYVKVIQKEKIISIFGYQFFIVLTGSMEPEIQKDSFIVVRQFSNYKVRRNNYLS